MLREFSHEHRNILRRRLAHVGERPNAADRVDVLAFAAGAARSGGGWGVLPYSGHALFLTYVLLTGPGRGFRTVAVMLLVTTTWFKLALWNDPYSWSLGITIGVMLAAIRGYAAARAKSRVASATSDPPLGASTPSSRMHVGGHECSSAVLDGDASRP